jgi:hypothetical protein
MKSLLVATGAFGQPHQVQLRYSLSKVHLVIVSKLQAGERVLYPTFVPT